MIDHELGVRPDRAADQLAEPLTEQVGIRYAPPHPSAKDLDTPGEADVGRFMTWSNGTAASLSAGHTRRRLVVRPGRSTGGGVPHSWSDKRGGSAATTARSSSVGHDLPKVTGLVVAVLQTPDSDVQNWMRGGVPEHVEMVLVAPPTRCSCGEELRPGERAGRLDKGAILLRLWCWPIYGQDAQGLAGGASRRRGPPPSSLHRHGARLAERHRLGPVVAVAPLLRT